GISSENDLLIDTNLHNLFNINNDTIYGTAHMYIATYITYYSWHIRIFNAYTNFKIHHQY
ncbi:hypothetical protein, partial [Clostridioides difficile]|uniref:hypothetical protein n=1 Tax=Clostridioides difficile TaxID=1496 RepID=UPI002FD6854E